MIGKLLDWWVNRYYSKGVGYRSVMLIQGEQDGLLVKVHGAKKDLKQNLCIAMKREKIIRDIVLEATELYRVTEDDPMEPMKQFLDMEQFLERNKEDNDN